MLAHAHSPGLGIWGPATTIDNLNNQAGPTVFGGGGFPSCSSGLAGAPAAAVAVAAPVAAAANQRLGATADGQARLEQLRHAAAASSALSFAVGAADAAGPLQPLQPPLHLPLLHMSPTSSIGDGSTSSTLAPLRMAADGSATRSLSGFGEEGPSSSGARSPAAAASPAAGAAPLLAVEPALQQQQPQEEGELAGSPEDQEGDGEAAPDVPEEPALAKDLGVPAASLSRLFRADGTHEFEQPVWMVINLMGKIKGSYAADKMEEFAQRGTLSARQLVLGIDRDLPYVLRQELKYYRPLGQLVAEVHAGGRYVPLSAAAAASPDTPWIPVVPAADSTTPPAEGSTPPEVPEDDGSGGGAAKAAAAPETDAAADAALRSALQRLFTSGGASEEDDGPTVMWLYINHLNWCRGPFTGGKLLHAHLCGRLPRDTLIVGYDPAVPVVMLSSDVAAWFRPLGALLENIAQGYSYLPVTWEVLSSHGYTPASATNPTGVANPAARDATTAAAAAAATTAAAPVPERSEQSQLWQPLQWSGPGDAPPLLSAEALVPSPSTPRAAPAQGAAGGRGGAAGGAERRGGAARSGGRASRRGGRRGSTAGDAPVTPTTAQQQQLQQQQAAPQLHPLLQHPPPPPLRQVATLHRQPLPQPPQQQVHLQQHTFITSTGLGQSSPHQQLQIIHPHQISDHQQPPQPHILLSSHPSPPPQQQQGLYQADPLQQQQQLFIQQAPLGAYAADPYSQPTQNTVYIVPSLGGQPTLGGQLAATLSAAGPCGGPTLQQLGSDGLGAAPTEWVFLQQAQPQQQQQGPHTVVLQQAHNHPPRAPGAQVALPPAGLPHGHGHGGITLVSASGWPAGSTMSGNPDQGLYTTSITSHLGSLSLAAAGAGGAAVTSSPMSHIQITGGAGSAAAAGSGGGLLWLSQAGGAGGLQLVAAPPPQQQQQQHHHHHHQQHLPQQLLQPQPQVQVQGQQMHLLEAQPFTSHGVPF